MILYTAGPSLPALEDQAQSWPHPRRLVRLRQRVSEAEERGGKRLLDVPGYRFQALVTSLWKKISSPFPNCNAGENHPAFTSPSA